jgi:hypothetical protein
LTSTFFPDDASRDGSLGGEFGDDEIVLAAQVIDECLHRVQLADGCRLRPGTAIPTLAKSNDARSCSARVGGLTGSSCAKRPATRSVGTSPHGPNRRNRPPLVRMIGNIFRTFPDRDSPDNITISRWSGDSECE